MIEIRVWFFFVAMGVKGLCAAIVRFLGNPTCLFTCGGINIICPCTLSPSQQQDVDTCYPIFVVIIIVLVTFVTAFIVHWIVKFVKDIRVPYDQVIQSKRDKIETKYLKLMIERESDISKIPFENGSSIYQITERMIQNKDKNFQQFAAELGNDPYKCMAVLLWLIASENSVSMVTSQKVYDWYEADTNKDLSTMTQTFIFDNDGVYKWAGSNQYIYAPPANTSNLYVYSNDNKLFYTFSVLAVCPYLQIDRPGSVADSQLITKMVEWDIDIEEDKFVSFDAYPYLHDCYLRTIDYKASTTINTRRNLCCGRSLIPPDEYVEKFHLVDDFGRESLGNYIKMVADMITLSIRNGDLKGVKHGGDYIIRNKLIPDDYGFCKNLSIRLVDIYTESSLHSKLEETETVKGLKQLVFAYENPEYRPPSYETLIDIEPMVTSSVDKKKKLDLGIAHTHLIF